VDRGLIRIGRPGSHQSTTVDNTSACYLIGDQNDYQHAVTLAQRAFNLFAECGDFTTAGKALVDVALMQKRLGQTDLAIAAYEASLALLPEDQWRSRFAAYHALGFARLDQGQFEAAQRCCELCNVTIQDHPGESRPYTSCLVLHAELAIYKKDWSTAKDDLGRARLRYLEDSEHFDLITVSLRLAQILLIRGEVAELRNLARQVSTLVDSLARHKFLEAALTRFVREAGLGEITLDVIDSVYLAFKNRGCPAKTEKSAPLGLNSGP
jgi:tetratricopeptide (TPR) repeat protein